MKKIIILFSLLFFMGCGDERFHMTLNDENGFKTTFDGVKKELKIVGWDKPFLLYYFSSDCGACAAQVPILNEIINEYGDKIKVIGILGDTKGFDKDMEILKDKKIKFAVVSNKKSVHFLANAVGGIMGTPVTVIFDKNGKIAKSLLGLYPKTAFDNELKLLMD